MHAFAPFTALLSLDSAICAPLTVPPDAPLLDAIALIKQHQPQWGCVFIVENSQVVGWLTEQDIVQLACSNIDFKTAKLAEVMNTSVIPLKRSEIPNNILSVLSLLRQHFLPVLPVIDDQSQLIGVITYQSLCQALETEAQKTIDALEPTQQRLHLLESAIVNADDAIIITQVNALDEPLCSRIVYVNKAFTAMSGWVADEAIGKTLEILHGDKTSHHEINRIRTALVTHSSIKTELIHYHKNGSTYWVEVSIAPIPNLEGRITHFVWIQRDITARKQALEALGGSEKRFRTLANETPVIIWMNDVAGLSNFEILVEERTKALKQINRQLIYEIADRQLAEEQLRQSQEMLQLIMDNIPQSVFWKDTASVFLGCNRNFAHLVGLNSPEEIVGKTDYDVTAKEEADLHRASDARVMETDTAEYHVIKSYLQKAGKQIWLETTKVPLHDAEGTVMGVLGTFEDITLRKQAEKALQQSEERFRCLVETTNDLVWEMDETSCFTYISPQLWQIMGYKPEELVGKTPFETMPSEQATRVAQEFATITATQEPFKFLEAIQIHKEGHSVVLEVSGVPVFDVQGTFRGYRGVSRDITSRKQAEVVLREIQERLQAMLDNSPSVIYLVDTQNKFLLINRKFEELFKITKEKIVGKSIYDIWSSAIADEFAVNNRKVLTQCLPIEAEEVVPLEDGLLHTYLSVKFPLKNTNGIPYGICGISTDITERKLVEESFVRFRKAIESVSDAIGMADLAGNAIYLNPAFTELFEYTLEELEAAGGPIALYVNQTDYEQAFTPDKTGESWRGEVTMQTRSGRKLLVEIRANAIKDATGKIIGSVGIHTDISERRRSEESLRLRDRAIAASSNGIVICDVTMPNAPIIYVNAAFEHITGYSAAEVIGRNFSFLQGVDTHQPELTILNDAITQGKSCTVVLRSYRKDGSLFWNEISISPVYDNTGKYTNYIGIQTDITERKQAEVALLVSQERLQYLLSSSPGVIYSCKPCEDYGSTFISENITAMMGYEAREFMEDSSFWLSHVHSEDVNRILTDVPKLFEHEQHSYEYRFLHKNGTYRWMYDQFQLMRDDAGNPLEIVGYWIDITERKQLEEELKAALQKEKELNELKSRFISMASHEFRTPLSTILSSSELLEHYRHKWTEEKQLAHLQRIQNAVQHMTEMLNNVLLIGKLDAGKLDFVPTSFDLIQYCRYLVEELQLNVKNQHTINFCTQYESIPCCMDEKLLGHILINILSNAIKYSPDGSIVQFTLRIKKEQAVFKIKDQGIGIPAKDLPYLFESFHRATNVGNIQGTGLGLAIVKKYVDIYSGEIAVESEIGVGTTFTVILPLSHQPSAISG